MAWGMSSVGSGAAVWLRHLNARHPWSHNDYFHSWILANLPTGRSHAVDLGCGRGELVRKLAGHFDHVLGLDTDPDMRRAATGYCAGLDNACIDDRQLDSFGDGSLDLITMVATLHHLDIEQTLAQVTRVLAPRGRFLVVGLATPKSTRDHLWDTVSVVTNPLIGFVHHPWPSSEVQQPPPFPVRDPVLSFDEIEQASRDILPGSVMRHRIGFRYTLEWTKPAT